MTNSRPTATQLTYYIICKRKLWLSSHHITFEHQNDNVAIGKLIDESTFSREKKSRMIDGIVNMDFIRGNTIVHEIKKSDSLEEAHIWQVKYYLYILSIKKIPIEKGIIHYPKQKKTTEVHLSQDDISQLETEIIPGIATIKSQDKSPDVITKPFCKTCSYYEFCYV